VQVDDDNHRPAKRIRGNAGPPRPGYAALAAAILAALAALAILLAALSATVWSDEPGPQTAIEVPSAAPASSHPATASAVGCAVETAEFVAFARARAGAQAATLDSLTLVCWEPAGQLRADSSYAADVNATSAPMTWLCATMSAYITHTGRAWQGFTVYSTHRITPGRPMLTGRTPGGTCTNPQHQPGG
jgi:hypothetical protein